MVTTKVKDMQREIASKDIEIQDLSKKYTTVRALHNRSVSAVKGKKYTGVAQSSPIRAKMAESIDRLHTGKSVMAQRKTPLNGNFLEDNSFSDNTKKY